MFIFDYGVLFYVKKLQNGFRVKKKTNEYGSKVKKKSNRSTNII